MSIMKILVSISVPFALLSMVTQAHAQKYETKVQRGLSADGALQLSVPFDVPPGPHGFAPHLALVYNSQVGYGAAKGGWALTGLPIITRCKRTLAQDGINAAVGFTSADGYCLDGERLIPVNGVNGAAGTEYRTQHDTFAKIVSIGNYIEWNQIPGGPVSFKVWTKAGLVLEFGTTADSQARMPNGGAPSMLLDGQYSQSNPIRAWAVHKVSDPMGNAYTIKYNNISEINNVAGNPVDDGAFYPTEISYTGSTGLNKVVFGWTGSSSSSPIRYAGGYAIPHAMILMNVDVVTRAGVPGSSTTKYWLEQDYSRKNPQDPELSYANAPPRLVSVQQWNCNTGVTLDAQHFSYAADGPVFQYWTGGNAFPGTLVDYKQYFVDVNGDGKKYWIQISQAAAEGWIGQANTNGTFAASQWTKFPSVGALNSYEHSFADVNGDGKADWIRVSRTTNEAWVALGQGNGTFQFWTTYLPSVGSENAFAHSFADLDGDGRVDLIQMNRTTSQVSIALGQSTGSFQFWNATPGPQINVASVDSHFVDLNNDGMADMVLVNRSSSQMTTYLSQGAGTFGPGTSQSPFPAGTSITLSDINDDGNADILATKPDRSIWFSLSKGNGNFTTPVSAGFSHGADQYADINGDGLVDLVSDNPSCLLSSYTLSTGGAVDDYYHTTIDDIRPPFPPGDTTLPPAGYRRYYADLNGDGKADLIMVNNTTCAATVAIAGLADPWRITSIWTDADDLVTIAYKPLTDPSVYVADSGAAYPLRDSIFPSIAKARMPYVVASVSAANGIGGTVNSSYKYGGRKWDARLGDSVGFRWATTTALESGLTTRTEYRQDWPLAGVISLMTKSGPPNVGLNGLLQKVETSYGCNDFVTVGGSCVIAPGRRYFAYPSQSVTSGWDLNGAVLPATTATMSFDGFGNALHVVSASSDGYTTTTDTVFNNDTLRWRIGKPSSVTIQRTAP